MSVRRLTATYIVHDPQPRSPQDWEDITGSLETAGNEVGLELVGYEADRDPDH